ncbi:unnamed protein product [Coregonus sp. 'balchen']|nr:unnamed protein product [Coregonus sp. 'balchen']
MKRIKMCPMKKDRVKFQRREVSSSEHCCVSLCSSSAKFSSLSFHSFPADDELRKKDLSQRFHIPLQIIITWASFLYTLPGAVTIWMSQEEVKTNLPEEFKSYPDRQVIVDCTELRCQTQPCLLLQSEMFSIYKSHCTMKAPGKVYRPPFLSKQSQMPTAEVNLTQEIARLRIHVERVIRRVKSNKLFDTNISLAFAGSINRLFTGMPALQLPYFT